VFDNSYISSVSAIDVQSLYLGQTPRRDHIEQLQSISRHRVKGFPLVLPTRARASVLQHPDLAELEQKRRELDKSSISDIQQVDKDIKATKARLLDRALKTYQKEWVDIEYEKFIESRGKSLGNPDPQARRFQRLLVFIPERKRLCAMIDGLIEYSEEQKMSLVEDLVTIASKDLENIYRPGEEPVDGCCPVIGCAFQISG
jgi:Protein of unknown function (DUF3435)